MDALETGKRIQQRRKQHGWTQKELAQRLCVSDKAVSKWERGLNFPDMALLKPLAEVLETTVTELLGIEKEQPAHTVELVAEVAAKETGRLRNEIRNRSAICLMMGIIWFVSQIVLSICLHQRGIDDRGLHMLSGGMTAFSGTLVGNSIWLLWKHWEL